MSTENLIEFKEITKFFPGVTALKNVSFAIKKGEVHALVGENGAGKSTLIKILSGVQLKDEGSIFVEGKETNIKNPKDAFNLGISCIYQELPLASSLSIADNIFLGQELKKLGFINKSQQNELSKKYFKDFDIDINPKTAVGKLSISMQQIVAIIKAMMKEAKLFIMDEPTATLGEHEVERLFDFIRKIKKRGISVLYISHRMDEIFDIADSVTVFKDGSYMGTRQVSEITKNELITMMSGKNIHDSSLVYDSSRVLHDEKVIEVKNLYYKNILKDINFSVKIGEIFGITGLVGAGKTELLKCLYGIYDFKKGIITLNGKETDRRKNKINIASDSFIFGFISEDRKKEGLFLNLSILQNISISSLKLLTKLTFIKKRQEVNLANKLVKDLGIKTPSITRQIKFLSGGNQQKVILSRWLSSKKSVLLMDEPTRGIDVLGKLEIYKLMNKLSHERISIIFSSSDVSEVLSIADRVAIMRNGVMVDVLGRQNFDKEKILRKMLID
ncbi:MAG: sugar ABC transporter ATP-binding protein [Candidatus Humimicrobiaceae bacterium]